MIKLNIPYHTQLNNEHNPYGSCNVTSVAMCLRFKGIVGDGDGQLEDQVFEYMAAHGLSQYSPKDLAWVMNQRYKIKDDFTEFGTIERCCQHLSGGNPCIIHGWFTQSGHIIVLVGYDKSGFLVHDPYGEWHQNGYDTTVSGAFLHYSYDLIRRLCIEKDNSFWVHYIG